MTINIADNTPRVSYTVAQGVTQTSFTVTFEFFAEADLNVYIDGVLKTLTTDYTVTGGNGSTGSITMSVTGASGGSTVVITRAIALERTTDFPPSGAFQINSLNTELDRFTAISADLNDEIGRSLRLTDYDIAANLTLPDLNSRKGTTLAFNATTGAVEAGPSVSGVTTVSAAAADIATLADIEDGTVATDAISDTAAIKTDVTTVAGIASNVTAAAANEANINAAVANAANINAAPANAQLAEDWAVKVNGIVDSSDYSSKAWAIGGTGVTDASGAGPAKDWATETTGQVDGTEYSAKEYAIGSQVSNTSGSAKQWSLGGGTGFDRDTAVTGSGITAEYSAKYWANQAANSAKDFVDVYYGAFTSDAAAETYQTDAAPTGNGGTVNVGDLYFNSADNVMRVRSFSGWNDVAADTTSFATNGFSIAMSIAL